jgi:alanine racemase
MQAHERELIDPMAWAEMDLGALSHNVDIIRQRLGQGTRFAGVVKKDAYGHGLLPVAQHLVSKGIDWLAVYSLTEALELRRANINIPILVFGFIPPEEAGIVVSASLTPTVMTSDLASALDSAARELDIIKKVHVKVDTGLNRSGVTLEDATQLLSFLFSLEHLEVEGLYTHFSSADELDKTPTSAQLKCFLDLAGAFPEVKMLHAANSAATLSFPTAHLSMVRVGISLYGLSPSPHVDRNISLRPVLSLKSKIARIHRLRRGDGVGYGLTWKAETAAIVALIPMGYGDGLPRLLSNRGVAVVRGHRVPIRGVISMDQVVLDVTTVPGAAIGDIVTFIGQQGEGQVTADEVADWAGTINYEVVTRLPHQLRRIYL